MEEPDFGPEDLNLRSSWNRAGRHIQHHVHYVIRTFLGYVVETEEPDAPLKLPLPKWEAFQELWNERKVLENNEVARSRKSRGWAVTPYSESVSDSEDSQDPRTQGPIVSQSAVPQQLQGYLLQSARISTQLLVIQRKEVSAHAEMESR